MKILNLKFKQSFVRSVMLVSLGSLALAACGGSSNNSGDATNSGMKTYKVTINNVTANQPFSPVAVVLHKSSYHLFQSGQAASIGLEYLAEGGSVDELLDEANADAAVIMSKSGSTHIASGDLETITISVANDTSDFKLSVATMLVNTNDAFAGVSSMKVAGLAVGESFSMHIPVWDAGTEANDEAQGSIPGPADGGEGFNASREGDVDFVAIHQGVVTHADGFATSVLDESHRFNNPVGLLRVERME